MKGAETYDIAVAKAVQLLVEGRIPSRPLDLLPHDTKNEWKIEYKRHQGNMRMKEKFKSW